MEYTVDVRNPLNRLAKTHPDALVAEKLTEAFQKAVNEVNSSLNGCLEISSVRWNS